MERLRAKSTIGTIPPKATEAEMENCPNTFTCYACLEKRPKAKLGGVVNGERLCTACRPYWDTWALGNLIRFDNRQAKPTMGPPKETVPVEVATHPDWEAIGKHNFAEFLITIPSEEGHRTELAKVKPEERMAVEAVRKGYYDWRIRGLQKIPQVRIKGGE